MDELEQARHRRGSGPQRLNIGAAVEEGKRYRRRVAVLIDKLRTTIGGLCG